MNQMNTDHKDDPIPDDPGTGKLGTFAGVFTPSILTILGIILFLRLGFVVGNAGLGRALIILFLANGISVLTTISLSAIATNLKVKGGGDYYLISRTLGLQFGGAIGIVLYLAQSVSIAFYCIGFGEVLAGLFQHNISLMPQIIAAFSMAFLFIFAWLGADWATKFQYVVMGILTLALGSFFIGSASGFKIPLLLENWTAPESGLNFWVLFAIFFPAVTGFTQGVSMSGDLRNPGKSLPLGTFLAVGLSIIVYFAAACLFAGSLPRNVMVSNYSAMNQIASIDFLITAGVIAATLSSAMASFLGAPRILQSLAGDRIFPFLLPFAKGFGPYNNPRRGVLLSGAIAFITICLGNLNIIAPVVSMFFLISYGLLNYATYFEARGESPSFRPRFRFYDIRISLTGAFACLGAMLAIDLTAGLIAVAVLFAIYQYLNQTAGPPRWADSRRSNLLQKIRENLLTASEHPDHPRDWRPQLLIFSDDSRRRGQLLKVASWIQGKSGFTTAVKILEGSGPKMIRLKNEAREELYNDIRENQLEAFPLAVSTTDIQQTIHTLVQSYGIGPLKANTVLLNFIEQDSSQNTKRLNMLYGRNLRTTFRFGCNVMILCVDHNEWEELEAAPRDKRRIDVWWWNDATSRFMLLLAYLMTRHEAWADAKIRVLSAAFDKDSGETVDDLKSYLDEIRIDAEPEIVASVDAETVAAYSSDATLVFLPFRFRRNLLNDPFGNPVNRLADPLPVTILATASEDIELDAEPEDGRAAEVAEAVDHLTDAEKQAKKAEKQAAKAAREVEAAREKLSRAMENKDDVKDMESVNKAMEELKETEKLAAETASRSATARAKADTAAREAENMGVVETKEEKDQE